MPEKLTVDFGLDVGLKMRSKGINLCCCIIPSSPTRVFVLPVQRALRHSLSFRPCALLKAASTSTHCTADSACIVDSV